MHFYPPFNIPFFFNNYRYPNKPFNQSTQNRQKSNEFSNYISTSNQNYIEQSNSNQNKKASSTTENNDTSEAFFEIFGLKLYFDDILIICILFFLYSENVHNDELFICLILILLT